MELAEDAFVKALDIQAMPKVLTIVLSAKDYGMYFNMKLKLNIHNNVILFIC